MSTLAAPFPYFGGKRRAASIGRRIRAASARPVAWLCPWCDDEVHARSAGEMWDGASKHLSLCAFYRVSGSWEAAQ